MTTLLYNPTITSFTPTSGPAGTTVTITGTHLLQSTGANALSVYYGNIFANSPVAVQTVTPVTNTAVSLSFVVPANAKTGFISIETDIGIVSTTIPFTVVPHVASYTPLPITASSIVTIVGSNLTDSTVTIGGINTPLIVNGYGALMVEAPSSISTGAPMVVSTTYNGVTTVNSETVTPVVTSYSPYTAAVGDLLTITGSNLHNSTVTIGGTAASLIENTYGAIAVDVPTGTTTGATIVVSTVYNGTTTVNTLTPTLTITTD